MCLHQMLGKHHFRNVIFSFFFLCFSFLVYHWLTFCFFYVLINHWQWYLFFKLYNRPPPPTHSPHLPPHTKYDWVWKKLPGKIFINSPREKMGVMGTRRGEYGWGRLMGRPKERSRYLTETIWIVSITVMVTKKRLPMRKTGGLFSGMLSFEILIWQNKHCLHSTYFSVVKKQM